MQTIPDLGVASKISFASSIFLLSFDIVYSTSVVFTVVVDDAWLLLLSFLSVLLLLFLS